MSSNEILCINNVEKDKLWIGTKNGLNILNIKSGIIKNLYYNPNDNLSIGSNKINNIFKDSDSQIWIGTAGDGLNLFVEDSADNYRFKRFTEADGLSDNTMLGILEDDHKNLWISTSYGLNRFSIRTQKFTNYYQTIIKKID